ncbi:MAG: hypothetical protein Fur0022_16950 [Anaerolineales bacterium]
MSPQYPSPAPENDLIDALAVCLDAMAIGSDLQTCLDMYPALADDLRPLLMTAQTAQVLSPIQIPVDAMNRSRTKMLGRAAEYRENGQPVAGFWGWTRRIPRFALSTVLTLVVTFAGLFALNTTANQALPGDSLYPLKLSIENLMMDFASGSEAEGLEQLYRQRRVDEVHALLAMGREEEVSFEGVFASLEPLSGVAPQRWLVGDIYVLRTIETDVSSEIEIGMLIQVIGRTRADGDVEAIILRPRAFAFVGVVEEITSNMWRVGGREVEIRAASELEPGIGLGDEVMVLAEFDDQVNLFARAILLIGEGENTSEPTAMPTQPAPTGTPPGANPTSTPTPTPSRTPASTLEPSVTPSPTAPQVNPSPTLTRTPTEDPNTPDPTTPVEPTATQEPTDEPTETEEPDDNGNENDNDNDNENENENDNENENENEN